MEPLQLWSQPQESNCKFAGDLPKLLCLQVKENQGPYLLINAGYANKRRLNETLSDQYSVLCVPKGAREAYVQRSPENKKKRLQSWALTSGLSWLVSRQKLWLPYWLKNFYIYLPRSRIVLFLIMTYALGRINSRDLGAGKCADGYEKKSILGPILQFLVVLGSLSVPGQLKWKYWGSVVLGKPGLRDWFYKQLACFVYSLGLSASQWSFPVAAAVKVDLRRAEKQIYFVV